MLPTSTQVISAFLRGAKRAFIHALTANVILVALIIIGLLALGEISDLRGVQHEKRNAAIFSNRVSDPAKLLYEAVPDERLAVNIIDNSLALRASWLESFHLKQTLVELNTAQDERLLIYIDYVSDAELQSTYAQLVAKGSNMGASLLLINYQTNTASFDLSSGINALISDNEIQNFLDKAVAPSLKARKLVQALESAIGKFNEVRSEGNDPLILDSSQDAAIVLPPNGTIDNLLSEKYFLKEENEIQSRFTMYLVLYILFIIAGIYHVWHSRSRIYGFSLGFISGGMVVIIAGNFYGGAYLYGIGNPSIPVLAAGLMGGALIGGFVDYLISRPDISTEHQIKNLKKRSKKPKL